MSDTITQLAALPRIVRPELDRAELQTFELDRFYNVQEQRMVTPIRYRDDFTRRVAEEEPLTFPVVPVEPYQAAPLEADAPVEPVRLGDAEPLERQALREPFQPIGDLAGERGTVAATSAKIGTEAAAETPESMPYGADLSRMRDLVDGFLTGKEFPPVTFQYRQAGDLIPLTEKSPVGAAAAQRVAAVYKAS